jgi:hypothetical protein
MTSRTRRTLAGPVEAGMRRRLSGRQDFANAAETHSPLDLFPAELEAAIDQAVAELSALPKGRRPKPD